MCWVMPPASPAATSVSRTASSSEVLPWSTWPMIVTTGGRSTRSSSASSNTGSSSSSSSEWTISMSLLNSDASTSMVSSGSVWVSVLSSPSAISFFITSGVETPRYSATSLTVEPELMRMTSSTTARCGRTRLGLFVIDPAPTAPAALTARRLVGLRRSASAGSAARGLGIDDHPAPAAGAAGSALALQRVAGRDACVRRRPGCAPRHPARLGRCRRLRRRDAAASGCGASSGRPGAALRAGSGLSAAAAGLAARIGHGLARPRDIARIGHRLAWTGLLTRVGAAGTRAGLATRIARALAARIGCAGWRAEGWEREPDASAGARSARLAPPSLTARIAAL